MQDIYTPRLHLRPAQMADAAALYAIYKSPRVGPSAGWKPHANITETREILRAVFVNQPGVFALTRRADGALLGTMGLVPDEKRENVPVSMLGYALGEEYWGQGYASEAGLAVLDYGFAQMNLSLVSAYCYPGNKASRRVLEKCGFVHEGRLRQAEMLWNGKVMDTECFSITAEELACNNSPKRV